MTSVLAGFPVPGAATVGEQGFHNLHSLTGFWKLFQSQWGKILTFGLCKHNIRMADRMLTKNISVEEVIATEVVVL